jgi:hypothetical protein
VVIEDQPITVAATPVTNPLELPNTPFFHSVDLDESEEEVSDEAVSVLGYYIYNAAATTRFVKFFNDTAANVTVGTTVPDITLPIPAGAAANLHLSPSSWVFGDGLCVAATTGAADNDTGAPSAGDVMIQLWLDS